MSALGDCQIVIDLYIDYSVIVQAKKESDYAFSSRASPFVETTVRVKVLSLALGGPIWFTNCLAGIEPGVETNQLLIVSGMVERAATKIKIIRIVLVRVMGNRDRARSGIQWSGCREGQLALACEDC